MLKYLLNTIFVLLVLALAPARLSADVAPEQIDKSLQKGIDYLRNSARTSDEKAQILMAYTLAKTGSPPDHPLIAKTVNDLIQQFSKSDVKLSDHFYNAGVAAMLFDTLDGEKYQPQLQAIANYIVNGQRSNGGWYYPEQSPNAAIGDTSITQYALLGLWAAEKNGIEIPKSVWSRAATWLANTQAGNGAFSYHPDELMQDGRTGRPSLAVAGTSSLVLCLRQIYPNGFQAEIRKRKAEEASAESVKLYGGLLELIDVTKPDDDSKAGEDPADEALIPGTRIQAHINNGMRYLSSLPDMGLRDDQWRLYYIYGVERLGAFADIDQIGNSDWYQTGAEALISLQKPDGSWLGQQNANISTCFAVLFLYKATAKAIKPPAPPAPRIGSGLLAGGRGLPSDLRTVQQKDGRIVSETADIPVTDLLTQLESSAGAELRPIQEEIIETVRSSQRNELLGQIARLEKLLKSPDAEVRSIAAWALARSNDLSKAPQLIELIRKDPDYDVAREANRGLCVLSRRLEGVGFNADPISDLDREKETRKVEQRILEWRASTSQAWLDWYLKVRAYRERDDLLDLKK